MTDRDIARGLRAITLATVVVLSTLGALAGGVGGAAAAGNASIGSCTTIDTAGVHELLGDVNATSNGPCIAITASDVIIEGNGYAIGGYENNTFGGDGWADDVDGSTGITVLGESGAHVENVTVRNVTIEHGTVGFNATYGTNVTLEDATIRQTDAEAILTYQTNGTVELRDVTVEDSARYASPDLGQVHHTTAIDVGVTSTPPPPRVAADRIVVSNLTVENDGNARDLGTVTSVTLAANGPVTVTDSVVRNTTQTAFDVSADDADLAAVDEDVTLSNVTVEGHGLSDDGGDGVWADSVRSVTVRNSRVVESPNGSGFDLGADQGVTVTNSTVRNVNETGVSITGASTIRDVFVENTGVGEGITAGSGVSLTVENVTVTNTSVEPGWGASFYGTDETVVRDVRVTDSGHGGLRVGRDFAGSVDVQNVTVADVRNVYEPVGEASGGGLTVLGTHGTVENVTVSDTAGGVRVEEYGDFFEFSLSNLTVRNASHHGVDVRGDSVTLVDGTVENTSKVGVVKRPEPSSADDDEGRFVAQNVSINGTGAAGVAARYAEIYQGSGPNDHVNLTEVEVTNATGDGIDLSILGSAELHTVGVADAAGTDLNLTNTTATLDDVTLSGTRIDGDAQEVTVEPLESGEVSPLPDGALHVDTFIDANATATDGYLNATVHYADGDVPADLDESTLAVWRYDGSRWSATGGSVDPTTNTVSKHVSYFSTFALLGHDGTAPPPVNLSVDVSDTTGPVRVGEPLTVTADLDNARSEEVTESVQLLDFDGEVVDSRSVTVAASGSTTVDLDWTPGSENVRTDEVAVRSDHGWDTATVEVREQAVVDEPITACTVITKEGSYVVTENVTYDDGSFADGESCIDVRTDRVTIDGTGHAIEGEGGGTGILVDVAGGAGTDVTVQNLSVRDVSYGIEVPVPTEGTVDDVTLANVTTEAVTYGGLAVEADENATVSNLTVENATLVAGDGIDVDADSDGTAVRNLLVTNASIEADAGVVLDLSSARASLRGFELSNSTVDVASEALDLPWYNDNVTISDVRIADNDLDAESGSVISVDYSDFGTVFENVSIVRNRILSETGDGIEMDGYGDASATRNLIVEGNNVTVASDGMAFEFDATGVLVENLSVADNRVQTDERAGISVVVAGEDATYGGVSLRNNTVESGETGIELDLGGSSGSSYDVTVSENEVRDFDLTGIDLADVTMDPDTAVSIHDNDVRNESGAVTGIAIRTSGGDSTDNGTLTVAHNDVRTNGDAIVINDASSPGPVDAIAVDDNVLVASGFGVLNHNTASDGVGDAAVNATDNYWGTADGPSSTGPLADPGTGALADGSGSAVSAGDDPNVANVHFDPYLTSEPSSTVSVTVDSSNSPVTEGETLTVDATVSNTGDSQVSQTVALSIGDVERDSTTVTVAPGEEESVTLTWSTAGSAAGDYTAEVTAATDASSTSVTVETTDTSWPMVRGNPARTGYLNTSGPTDDVGVRWNYTTSLQSNFQYDFTAPAVVDDTVYFGARNPSSNGGVYAVGAETGAELWNVSVDVPTRSPPTVVDGTVYFGGETNASDGKIYAVDADTGDERWNATTLFGPTTSPAVVDGTVYVASEDYHDNGFVYALDADTGTQQWRADLTGDAQSSPTVANGRVYVGMGRYVYALDTADGSEVWSVDVGSNVGTAPAVSDGTVYVGNVSDGVYAIDVATGDERWNVTTESLLESFPVTSDGTVYFGTRDRAYAVDADTGTEQWNVSTAAEVSSDLAITDEALYYGSIDDHVYALDADTGATLWNFSTGDWVTSPPAVVNGTVYVGSRDGNLYALSEGPLPSDVAVAIDATNSPVTERETLTVDATVSNTGGSRINQAVALSVGDVERDSTTVTVAPGEEESVTLAWDTAAGDAGTHTVSVAIDGEAATTSVNVEAATDSSPLAAFTYSPSTVYVGEEATFDASGSTDDVAIETYEWDFDDGTTDTGLTASHTFSGAGSYSVTMTVTDDSGNAATRTVEVTVETADEGDGDDADGDDADGDDADGDEGTDSVTNPSGSESVDTTITDEGVSVSVSDAQAGREVDVAVPADVSSDVAVDFTGLTIVPTGYTDIELDVRADGDSRELPPVSDTRPASALSYLEVSHEVEHGDLESVKFEFRVSNDRLADLGRTPEDVVLYRYTDERWTAVTTEMTRETDSDYTFTATSSGLSVFAVGVEEPTFRVQDASLERTSTEPGSAVSIEATVENTGATDGTYTAELVVDGAVVDSTAVTVSDGERQTVVFDRTFESEGSYEISVADTHAGTLTVEAPATATPSDTKTPPATTTPPKTTIDSSTESPTRTAAAETDVPSDDRVTTALAESPPRTPTESSGQPGFGLVLALAAIALAAASARYR